MKHYTLFVGAAFFVDHGEDPREEVLVDRIAITAHSDGDEESWSDTHIHYTISRQGSEHSYHRCTSADDFAHRLARVNATQEECSNTL